MPHSLDQDGKCIVNLNDYAYLSNSILWREKIDSCIRHFNFPKELSHFSVTIRFYGGHEFFISNLYYWAIPYRTEGLYRGDVDHHKELYTGKEFFIQRELRCDEAQKALVRLLEQRYRLNTVFAIVRESDECDLIIEAYSDHRYIDPNKIYKKIKNQLINFVDKFLNAMMKEIRLNQPQYAHLRIFNDPDFRRALLLNEVGREEICLTAREIECLTLLKLGKKTHEIADTLCLSDETINSHRKSILKKLCSSNMIEAIGKAMQRRLIV